MAADRCIALSELRQPLQVARAMNIDAKLVYELVPTPRLVDHMGIVPTLRCDSINGYRVMLSRAEPECP